MKTPDLLTLAALAVVVYATGDVIHEGLGHGGTCVLVGGRPIVLTSMHFDGDTEGLGELANRLIAAGGTVANLIAGVIALFVLQHARATTPATWLFLWLFASVNLFQATGYPLFSGVGGIGDWVAVIKGWSPTWLWRVLLAVVGGASYLVAVRWSMTALASRLEQTGSARVKVAYLYTLPPYLTGAALFVAAGLRNQEGLVLVAVSAVASSLGGTSGFAWGPQFLHDPDIPAARGVPPVLSRNWAWIVAAGIIALAFILVLGPGIHFQSRS
jgi:hypothetical protein